MKKIIVHKKVNLVYIPTILRVGHTQYAIQCNKSFLLLEKKQKELLVCQMSFLLKEVLKNTEYKERYLVADKNALLFMHKKYPKVNKIYWLKTFKSVFETVAKSSLNVSRIGNLSSIKLTKK